MKKAAWYSQVLDKRRPPRALIGEPEVEEELSEDKKENHAKLIKIKALRNVAWAGNRQQRS